MNAQPPDLLSPNLISPKIIKRYFYLSKLNFRAVEDTLLIYAFT